MRRAAIAIVLGLAAFVAPVSAHAFVPKHLVHIFGDSLTSEIKTQLSDTSTVNVQVHAFPSYAACDLLDKMQTSIARGDGYAFAVELAGNSQTQCMKDASNHYLVIGSSAWEQKYRDDMNAVFAAVTGAGARMVVLSPPPFLDAGRDQINSVLIPHLQSDAANYSGSITFATAPRAAVSIDDAYTQTMACMASEGAAQGCSGGQITVRDSVGLHFCPTGFDTTAKPTFCGVYSSGAVRYGGATEQVLIAAGA